MYLYVYICMSSQKSILKVFSNWQPFTLSCSKGHLITIKCLFLHFSYLAPLHWCGTTPKYRIMLRYSAV